MTLVTQHPLDRLLNLIFLLNKAYSLFENSMIKRKYNLLAVLRTNAFSDEERFNTSLTVFCSRVAAYLLLLILFSSTEKCPRYITRTAANQDPRALTTFHRQKHVFLNLEALLIPRCWASGDLCSPEHLLASLEDWVSFLTKQPAQNLQSLPKLGEANLFMVKVCAQITGILCSLHIAWEFRILYLHVLNRLLLFEKIRKSKEVNKISVECSWS